MPIRRSLEEIMPRPLTPVQRTALQAYRAFHREPPSVGGLAWRSRRAYALLLALAGAAMALALVLELGAVATFAAGILTGAAARDLGWFRRSVQVWPALSRLIERVRLDAFLAPDEASADTASVSSHCGPQPGG
jgi:hypothetical protein